MNRFKKSIIAVVLTSITLSSHSQTIMPFQGGRGYMPDEWLLGTGQIWHYKSEASHNGRVLESREPTKNELNAILSLQNSFYKMPIKAILLGDGNKIVKSFIKSPATEHSLFLSLSMDKTVTAVSAGVAICDNKITLDTKVKDVLPELNGVDIGETTLRDNLTMSSGTTSSFSDQQSLTPSELSDIQTGKKSFMDMMKSRWGKNNTTLFNVKKFDYKSQDPNLVAMTISAAYGLNGKHFRKWQHENLFTKIRTNDRRIQGQDQYDYAWAEGNTRLTLNDWARFAIYINDERRQNSCMGNYLREATRTQVKNDKKFTQAFDGYGYFIWTDSVHISGAFAALGYGGQAIVWNNANNKYFIVFSNQLSAMDIGQLAKIWIES